MRDLITISEIPAPSKEEGHFSSINDIKMERILTSNHYISGRQNVVLKDIKINLKPKIIKRINWILFLLIISVVAYMFHLKSNVQDLSTEYRQIISQIEEENKQHNLLKAELAYLNSPHRLQALASQYLKLDNVKPSQFVMETKNVGALNSSRFTEFSNVKSSKKWRYKDNSVLKTISYSKKKRK